MHHKRQKFGLLVSNMQHYIYKLWDFNVACGYCGLIIFVFCVVTVKANSKSLQVKITEPPPFHTGSFFACLFQEQQRLQNSGFGQRAQGMEEDILRLRQEQKRLKDKKRQWLGRLGSGLQAVGPVAALLPGPGTVIGLAAVGIGSFLKMFE